MMDTEILPSHREGTRSLIITQRAHFVFQAIELNYELNIAEYVETFSDYLSQPNMFLEKFIFDGGER